jgi:hypothetical protein
MAEPQDASSGGEDNSILSRYIISGMAAGDSFIDSEPRRQGRHTTCAAA